MRTTKPNVDRRALATQAMQAAISTWRKGSALAALDDAALSLVEIEQGTHLHLTALRLKPGGWVAARNRARKDRRRLFPCWLGGQRSEPPDCYDSLRR